MTSQTRTRTRAIFPSPPNFGHLSMEDNKRTGRSSPLVKTARWRARVCVSAVAEECRVKKLSCCANSIRRSRPCSAIMHVLGKLRRREQGKSGTQLVLAVGFQVDGSCYTNCVKYRLLFGYEQYHMDAGAWDPGNVKTNGTQRVAQPLEQRLCRESDAKQ